MNGPSHYDQLKPVIEWLEKQPRYALAWLLAECTITHAVYRMCPTPVTFDQALATLRHDVAEVSGLARSRARSRKLNRLVRRIEGEIARTKAREAKRDGVAV